MLTPPRSPTFYTDSYTIMAIRVQLAGSAFLLTIALYRFFVVRLEGLEPPTHCLEGSCSFLLSYRRP